MPKPQFQVRVTAVKEVHDMPGTWSDSDYRELLAQPPQPAFVTRMLADAMDSHSIRERLFDEQLLAQHFEEAAGIIWLALYDRDGCEGEDAVNLTVYSSEHWLESMRSISEFESSAYNDSTVREKEHG